MGSTITSTNMLDVLWTSDGAKESVDPSNLVHSTVPQAPTQTQQTTSTASALSRIQPELQRKYTRSYKSLLRDKFPTDLICPLDSSDREEIERYQMRLDHYVCGAHPRIRQLITGELEPPLLSFKDYIDYKEDEADPDPYTFDHATADEDIKNMRNKNLDDLADMCDALLDNPPTYDGFRPCNAALFQAIVKSIRPKDMYILRSTTYGDGIRLRNTIWDSMTGDACKSKKLLAMTQSTKISDVVYRFERHGIKKYFAQIHTVIAKLKTLGAQKQDWEVFAIVFDHMSRQCMEFRDAVKEIRDQLSKDEDIVTLKYIESIFQRKETVFKIGTSNKGTKVTEPTAMRPPPSDAPVIPAAKATAIPQKGNKPPLPQSRNLPELQARRNYGAKNSHKPGSCKYSFHKNETDHCWSGCDKCGGCVRYHKRCRLINEGRRVCMVHPYSTHLESECRGKFQRAKKRQRNDNDRRYKGSRSPSSDRRSNKSGSYNARSARNTERRSTSRSPPRHRSSRSPPRYRSRGSSSSRSPDRTSIPARFIKPRYLRQLEQFAQHGHTGERDHARRHDRHHDDSRSQKSSTSSRSSQVSSASAMQRQTTPRRDMGHVPHADGTPTLSDLLQTRNAKRQHSHAYSPLATHRRVVASAANKSCTQSKPQTYMDSGAGTTICDDDDLYIPSSIRNCDGEVVWGDGSTRDIKFTGKAPGVGSMVNTGGAASTHLMSVGATLDNLSQMTNNKFIMGFDNEASFLIRGAHFEKDVDGEYRLRQQDTNAPVLKTSSRGEGPAGVYEVPLYDARVSEEESAKTSSLEKPLSSLHACKAHLFNYPTEPKWEELRYDNDNVVFDAKVALPSPNVYALAKAIMRKHREWGHPGPEALRQMLIAKGTKRSLRMARRVHQLFDPCNACLSGFSNKQPHVRDDSQPSTKSTRPLQHVASDCTGEQNIVSMGSPSLSGATIIFIIICTFSRYLWLWLLKSTSEVTGIVDEWLRTTVRQRKRLAAGNNTAIETWRSDNGPDFPRSFTDLLAKNDIYHQRTGARASQQNPHAESALDTLEKRVRTNMVWSHAPRPFWGESALYTATTTCHLTSLANPGKKAPITVLYGRKPDFDKMHPFGCLAFIHVPKKSRNGALNTATQYGMLLGYATGSDGRIISYRVYNFDTNRYVYPADVTFNPDCPAIPYIASIRQLAPPMRLRNRMVRKLFNNVPYYGKVIDVRKDSDGEILYGIAYSDNDYEEMSFKQVLEVLQPYDPLEDDHDLLEITPFLGASKKHLAAADTVTHEHSSADLSAPYHGSSVQNNAGSTSEKTSISAGQSKSTAAPSAHRSARVRVVRRPHNVGTADISSIPSSQNKRRLRSAMTARANMFDKVMALSAKQRRAKPNSKNLVPALEVSSDTFVDQLPLPRNYDDAVLGPYRNYWIPAIATEMRNLTHYKVWEKQKLPDGVIPVRGRFVFKWKPDANNHLERAKARFTMQGCTQIRNLHFKKTYAPVAFAESLRLIVKIGVELDYEVDVTDLEAFYLTAFVEPNITLFLEPPPGVQVEDGYGLRVIRALYGSMQGAHRADVMKHKSLTEMGYTRMKAETSIYYTLPPSPLGLSVIGTVSDDFVIIAKDAATKAEIKRRLSTVWTISDKGPIKWLLNMRIHRDRPRGILKIEQSAYIERKLREFGLDNLPPKKLPMNPRAVFSEEQCPKTEQEKRAASKLPYRSRTGSLNYLRLTHPEMCCTNSILAQRNKCWGQAHFDGTTHAWQYAGGAKHWGLIMRKSGWKLGEKMHATVYVDAGHGSCPDTRRSRDGFFIFLNGDPINFGCNLQPGVPAQSTSVAEYRAITTACNALIWMRSCLRELGLELHEPVLFREDNMATISMATNYMTTKRTKHVDIKHHVIRYWCDQDVMDFTYIESSNQLADIMTKVLTMPHFRRHRARCMSDMEVQDDNNPFIPV